MSVQPSVVVNKKGGFLTALVQGVFGFLIVAVVCGAGLGLYGMWIVDKNTYRFLETLANAEDWSKLAPPIVVDALNDWRDVTYRNQLQVAAELAPRGDGSAAVVLTATNLGDESVTALTANVVVSDAAGVPINESVVLIATPIAFDCAWSPCWSDAECVRAVGDHWERKLGGKRVAEAGRWRGPLLSSSTRRFVVADVNAPAGATVSVEITDVRLWAGSIAALEAENEAADGAAAQPAPATLPTTAGATHAE